MSQELWFENHAHFSDSELKALVRLNELRASDICAALKDELEAQFASRFNSDCQLAVYGSLAPGQSNHHLIAPIPGDWVGRFVVHGDLHPMGWGAALGHPALLWKRDGPEVQVNLFISPHLPRHWPNLDEFEGEDYRRILVPLYQDGQFITVANLYEASRRIDDGL
jgi:gamma-glutamylcyclotransferase (GGCT)/AIG2-like uncharacterized protein YtfP